MFEDEFELYKNLEYLLDVEGELYSVEFTKDSLIIRLYEDNDGELKLVKLIEINYRELKNF